MDGYSDILAHRALNYWRPIDISTYLGLRLFLLQVHSSKSSNFIKNYLLEKMPLRQSSRYRHFLRFKGISPVGEIEYRDMYGASPSSALSEAYVISLIHASDVLPDRPFVYSYRWACGGKGRLYEYFFSGYRKRNEKVAELLRQDTDYRVIANDIRRFYPSINNPEMTNKLISMCRHQLDSGVREKQQNLTEHLLLDLTKLAPRGVPIGPGIGHVLGNLALAAIDREMHQHLNDRYLRYVDDIFMVVHKKDVAGVQRKLKSLLCSQGFDLNEDKFDVLSSEEWLDAFQKKEEVKAGDDFSELLGRIGACLMWTPGFPEDLGKCFVDAGIAMPLGRLVADKNYSGYHRYLRFLYKTTDSFKRIVRQSPNQTPVGILSDIQSLRARFSEYAAKIQVSREESRPLLRKLQIQRLRFLLNRLLYLTRYNDYPSLVTLAPNISEFYEFRVLLDSLVNRSLDKLIKIPGPAISTFASLSQELKLGKFGMPNQKIDAPAIRDSLGFLAAFGVLDPPEEWIRTLPFKEQEYFRFCGFQRSDARALRDFSYEDELRSIQLNHDLSLDRQTIARTRFSRREELGLDALMMGDDGVY